MPFAVLLDGEGKHLIERFSLSHAPSATALMKMKELGDRRDREAVPKRTSLVLGRPVMPAEDFTDLPHSEQEAKVVAKLLGAESTTEKDATESRLKRDIGTASYVHVASHGRTNSMAPMHTHIALTKEGMDDGLLHAHELMGMKLKARLVVLSACDTASKGTYNGEGLLGLGWALFVAGSPSNLLTLWAIDDASTSSLMKEFYTRFAPSAEKGIGAVSRAEALRQAQLKLLADDRTKHPSHWAAFILVGDWRR